ncbi:SHOCT domain-containing protein [Lysinibacillus sp. UBA5990]|uniref:SHOCT domain-containing protein n=1 Tax=Lysinibacillus sp. UBA5990 TaxID=1946773 RepID=UPI0025C4D1C6|nr:SHOCT domain-containing protein [Lysinibacillus sp. UBA5990]
MSFFKKIMGTFENTPERQAVIDAKERTKQEDIQQREKYVGTSLYKGMKYTFYKPAIDYFENTVQLANEIVLSSLPAEYDFGNLEKKGLLIATNMRVVFVTKIGNIQLYTPFNYKYMEGVLLASDGIAQKELTILTPSLRATFDDILNDNRLNKFIDVVQKQMQDSKDNHRLTNDKKKLSTSADPYSDLEKIANLRDKGILTEEEFLEEKKKILG